MATLMAEPVAKPAAHTRVESRMLLTYESGFGGETDSPLEEDGFEPSVPPAKKDPPRRDVRPFQHFPSERDRGFESAFLHRRVWCEPIFGDESYR
jgi:hypothetical protein